MDAIVLAKSASTEFDANRDALVMTRDLPVTSDEERDFAAEGLRWVKEQHAAVEEKRTAITGPLNKALREVNALFRPMKTALEEAERELKKKIAGYLAEREVQNLRAIQAAAVAETPAQASEALAAVAPAELPRGVSQRFMWVFEITDAAVLPREYLMPDMVKIGQAVRDSDGAVEIPGITIRKESILAARRV